MRFKALAQAGRKAPMQHSGLSGGLSGDALVKAGRKLSAAGSRSQALSLLSLLSAGLTLSLCEPPLSHHHHHHHHHHGAERLRLIYCSCVL
eukprot:2973700-Rhodomonas_salina.1